MFSSKVFKSKPDLYMVVMPNLNFILWWPELKRVTFLGKVALATAATAQTAVAEPENVKKIVQVFLH